MTIYLIIEFTILLVGIILFFTIKNFLPSYFNEKGKNLATKEDIEEITNKVEKIKSEFIKEIEFIKSDLSYINQNKFSIKASERDALIETNKKYSNWLNYLMNISFSDINLQNYSKINDTIQEIKSKKLEFDIAQDNLHLFLNDEELMELKMLCVTETLKLEYILVKALSEVENKYNIRKIYFDSLNSLPENEKPNSAFTETQLQSFYKELDTIFYEMNEEKAKQFQNTHKNKVLFFTALKKRLYNIMLE